MVSTLGRTNTMVLSMRVQIQVLLSLGKNLLKDVARNTWQNTSLMILCSRAQIQMLLSIGKNSRKMWLAKVAHLVEQLTNEPQFQGSNLGAAVTWKKYQKDAASKVAHMTEQLTNDPQFEGSNARCCHQWDIKRQKDITSNSSTLGRTNLLLILSTRVQNQMPRCCCH